MVSANEGWVVGSVWTSKTDFLHYTNGKWIPVAQPQNAPQDAGGVQPVASIAMASAAEVQSHLYVGVDQGYLSQETFDSIYAQAEKTSRIISGLIKYLRRKTRQTK